MPVKEILLLGNPDLYKISEPTKKEELDYIANVVTDLHDTMMDFKKKYNAGRAIAAPQIGVMKRLIYMFIDKPVVFINPVLENKSDAMFEVWDDCMSFPEIFVKVKRHKSCSIRYLNMDFSEEELFLVGDLSELLQHEYDHLDGILAVSRAIDGQSFALKSQRKYIKRESEM